MGSADSLTGLAARAGRGWGGDGGTGAGGPGAPRPSRPQPRGVWPRSSSLQPALAQQHLQNPRIHIKFKYYRVLSYPSVRTYLCLYIHLKLLNTVTFYLFIFLVQNSLKARLLSCREPSDHLHRKADPPVSFARDVTCVAARAVRVASWEHWNRRRVALSGLRLPALVSAESFHHTGTSKPCQPSLSVAVSALPVINDFSSQFMSSQETARAPEPLPGALPGSARAPAVQMEFDSQG